MMPENAYAISGAADILVVDDTIASLRLLTEILGKAGYRVRPADDPHLALQSALAHPPSLILLDVRMPDMDGFEVCRRLKQDERTRDVPVIFVSALQDVHDRVQGFEVGGVDFVSKPIEEAEVLARVKTHLELRTMQLHLEELVAERTAELVQTNQALRESEERYRTLVEQAQDGIIVLQNNKIRFANSFVASLSGRTVEELLDTPFEAYLEADQIPQVRDLYRRRMNGEDVPAIYESAIQHRNGSRVEVEFNAGLTIYDGKPADLVIVRDITERKQAESALRESEQKFKSLFESSPDLVALADLEGTLLDINRVAPGYRKEEVIGSCVTDYLTPQEKNEFKAAVAKVIKTGEPHSYEPVITNPEGIDIHWHNRVSPLKTGGKVDRLVINFTDITARKRAESQREALLEELRRSNERLEEAQRTAQIGDWEYDILAGKVTWSDEMYRIRGVVPERYVPTAKSDEEFCHPDDVPLLRRAFEEFFASGEPLDLDYRIVTPAGRLKACRRRGRLMVDDRGTPCLAIGTTEDITERWRAEQQVLEYQQRLQALASQLTLSEERERRRIARELHDEVGQTLAFARTGLASARKAPAEAERDAILDDVSQSLRQAIRDTRDLVFDLSSPLMNELGLGAALREWLGDQVGKKHGIQTDFVYDDQRFPLDDDMRAILFRCTRELLTNVVKHAQARRVTVRLEGGGALVRIVVEDDGVGFDVDARPETVEREGGFGLFSIQERMADLGGSLEMSSEPGQGCTATLTAPVTVKLRGEG